MARSINIAVQPMVAATPKQTFGWRAGSTAVAVADVRQLRHARCCSNAPTRFRQMGYFAVVKTDKRDERCTT
ncbi:MAG: hypothetical protein WAL59_32350, partial [Roseiarcus sp.]